LFYNTFYKYKEERKNIYLKIPMRKLRNVSICVKESIRALFERSEFARQAKGKLFQAS